MSRLSCYLLAQTLYGVAGAAAVIGAVVFLIDFVETSRDIATRADIGSLQVAYLSLLKAPLLIQDALPFIVLFGVLWTFFRLNRRSELIVLRASGFSAWRMLVAPSMLAIALGVGAVMALNPLGAAMNAEFERLRERVMARQAPAAVGTLVLQTPAGDPVLAADMFTQLAEIGAEAAARRAAADRRPVWLRETTSDGYAVITAEGLDPSTNRLEAPVFHFYVRGPDGTLDLDERYDAAAAVLRPTFWSLEGAVRRVVQEPPEPLGAVSLPTQIGPQALFERSRSPGAVSIWSLPDVIRSAEEAGLSTREHRLRLNALIALPAFLAAAALLAVAATLRLARLGGAAGFALVGAGAGFALYFLQELLSSLGASGALDPVSAAWSAPAAFALAALVYIASTEDG